LSVDFLLAFLILSLISDFFFLDVLLEVILNKTITSWTPGMRICRIRGLPLMVISTLESKCFAEEIAKKLSIVSSCKILSSVKMLLASITPDTSFKLFKSQKERML